MENIELYENKEIINKLNEFDDFGGIIDIKVFKVDKSISEYNSHFLTAKNSILELQNNSRYFKIDFDENKLTGSGRKISVQEFLGPWFDFELKKPILRGFRYLNNMFYFDMEETDKNIINIRDSELFKSDTSELLTIGFAQAFLNPVHGFRVSNSIYETGKYFIDFCEFLFSDLKIQNDLIDNFSAKPFLTAEEQLKNKYGELARRPAEEYFNLVSILIEKGNDLGAISVLKSASEAYPMYIGLLTYLAKLYEKTNQMDKAIETYLLGIEVSKQYKLGQEDDLQIEIDRLRKVQD